MVSSFATSAPQTSVLDILTFLPVSARVEYRKGRIIYHPAQPSTSLYLVSAGTVKLSQIAKGGCEVLLEIIRPDELFGESALLNIPGYSDQATALDNTELMSWPISTIEDLWRKQPGLAVSLLQISAQRTADFAQRIKSLSTENIQRRLIRSLIRFSQRVGAAVGDGSVRIMPLTHQLLARHVGATREVVTGHMNQFRKQRYLDYSREGIILYPRALDEWTTGTYADQSSDEATGRSVGRFGIGNPEANLATRL